jgi:hypothetical protein
MGIMAVSYLLEIPQIMSILRGWFPNVNVKPKRWIPRPSDDPAEKRGYSCLP